MLVFFDHLWEDLECDHIPRDVKSNTFVLRLFGFWPAKNGTWKYDFLTIMVFVLSGVVFPTTQILNIFAAASIYDTTACVFLAISHYSVGIKLLIFYWQQANIRTLFNHHAKIDELALRRRRDADFLAECTGFNERVFKFFTWQYVSVWTVCAMQAIWHSESLVWPSTSNLSPAIADIRWLYWSVLIFQGLSHLTIVILVASIDSFMIAVMTMNCTYVKMLKTSLRALPDEDDRFYAELIDCCKCYEQYLR